MRLGFVACEYFKTDIGAATPRLEHEAFYKRVFRMNVTAPARTFPTLTKAHSLMSVHYPSVREKILWRYPFFRSTFFERRMLFERHYVPLQAGERSPPDGRRARDAGARDDVVDVSGADGQSPPRASRRALCLGRCRKKLERAIGIEPTTFSLGS